MSRVAEAMATTWNDRPRILCREYAWNRLLTKSDSLPRLRFEPRRVLFDCSLCGFTNTLGHTCPWCLSACKTRAPRVSAARRRVSCPQLLSEAQQAHMRTLEARSAMATRTSYAVSTDSPVYGRARGPRACRSLGTTRRQKHRKAAIRSTADIVATIASDFDAELRPFLNELIGMADDDSQTDSHVPTPSLEPFLGAVSESAKTEDAKSVESSSTSTSMSQRTLRRKQRMTMLRQRSSRSLRKRSMPLLSKKPSILAQNAMPTVTVQIVPSRSPSPSSASPIPLGHPERPLYTAIRKNMSPPGLLPSSLSNVGHIPLHAVLLERGAKSLDMPRPATVGRAHGLRQPVAASGWTAGCSLTGETELRMGLARCRSADTPQCRTRDANLGGVVREKVKNLGRGLRELLSRRT